MIPSLLVGLFLGGLSGWPPSSSVLSTCAPSSHHHYVLLELSILADALSPWCWRIASPASIWSLSWRMLCYLCFVPANGYFATLSFLGGCFAAVVVLFIGHLQRMLCHCDAITSGGCLVK